MFILMAIHWNCAEGNYFYTKNGSFVDLYEIAKGMNAIAEINFKRGKGGRNMHFFENDKIYFSTFEDLSIILIDEKDKEKYL